MPPGRSTKLTNQVAKTICESIELGLPYYLSYEAAGVSYDVYNDWMRWGNGGKDEKYVQFLHSVKASEAACALNCLKRIRAKVEKTNSPYYDTWMLSRKFDQDFGERQHITSDNKSINENLNFNVDDADAILK
jgi:hypothetical protein